MGVGRRARGCGDATVGSVMVGSRSSCQPPASVRRQGEVVDEGGKGGEVEPAVESIVILAEQLDALTDGGVETVATERGLELDVVEVARAVRIVLLKRLAHVLSRVPGRAEQRVLLVPCEVQDDGRELVQAQLAIEVIVVLADEVDALVDVRFVAVPAQRGAQLEVIQEAAVVGVVEEEGIPHRVWNLSIEVMVEGKEGCLCLAGDSGGDSERLNAGGGVEANCRRLREAATPEGEEG